jgi:hypothetical protein
MRMIRPVSFVWRQWLQGAEFFAALIATLVAIVTGHFLAAAVAAAALVAQSASLLVLQRRYGGAPIPAKWAVMPMAFFLVAPYVLVKNMLKNRVEWRGRAYKVDTSTAALAVPVSQPSKPVPVPPIRRAA